MLQLTKVTIVTIGMLILSAAVFAEEQEEIKPVLWLQADKGIVLNEGKDEGKVAEWKDQSGAGNDVSQKDLKLQPKLIKDAINGKAALFFDGKESLVNAESFTDAKAPQNIFVVAQLTGKGTGGTFISFMGNPLHNIYSLFTLGTKIYLYTDGKIEKNNAFLPNHKQRPAAGTPFLICYSAVPGKAEKVM